MIIHLTDYDYTTTFQGFQCRCEKNHTIHIPPERLIGWSKRVLGVVNVLSMLEERAVRLAEYIIENNATVRAAAKRFGVSKSTVHKDVTQRLEKQDPALWAEAKAVLERNKAERHIRGGIATRIKYKGGV